MYYTHLSCVTIAKYVVVLFYFIYTTRKRYHYNLIKFIFLVLTDTSNFYNTRFFSVLFFVCMNRMWSIGNVLGRSCVKKCGHLFISIINIVVFGKAFLWTSILRLLETYNMHIISMLQIMIFYIVFFFNVRNGRRLWIHIHNVPFIVYSHFWYMRKLLSATKCICIVINCIGH